MQDFSSTLGAAYQLETRADFGSLLLTTHKASTLSNNSRTGPYRLLCSRSGIMKSNRRTDATAGKWRQGRVDAANMFLGSKPWQDPRKDMQRHCQQTSHRVGSLHSMVDKTDRLINVLSLMWKLLVH